MRSLTLISSNLSDIEKQILALKKAFDDVMEAFKDERLALALKKLKELEIIVPDLQRL